MGSVFTCKLNPCCGDRRNCDPPRQYHNEPDECATEGCGKYAAVHFERGGVGAYYCHACYIRIHLLPVSPQGGR